MKTHQKFSLKELKKNVLPVFVADNILFDNIWEEEYSSDEGQKD